MKTYSYYNDIDPFVCKWLRELIKAGLIMDGEVDQRSIADVKATDIRGFTRHHFFAGIGGWERAFQIAGWPEERPVCTASLPCQPFSVAGKQQGQKDERHLFPEFERLVKECRFPTIFGEQVPGAIRLGWLDGVFDALEKQNYTCGAVVLPACSVGAPHLRQRLWWVANSQSNGWGQGRQINGKCEKRNNPGQHGFTDSELYDGMANSIKPGLEGHSWDGNNGSEPGWIGKKQDGSVAEGGEYGRLGITNGSRPQQGSETSEAVGYGSSVESASFWSEAIYWPCSDGKHRRIPAAKPGFQPVVDGVRDRMGDLWDDGIAQALTGFPLTGKVPNRVGLLKGAGNSIVPQVAAIFIRAFLERGEK